MIMATSGLFFVELRVIDAHNNSAHVGLVGPAFSSIDPAHVAGIRLIVITIICQIAAGDRLVREPNGASIVIDRSMPAFDANASRIAGREFANFTADRTTILLHRCNSPRTTDSNFSQAFMVLRQYTILPERSMTMFLGYTPKTKDSIATSASVA